MRVTGKEINAFADYLRTEEKSPATIEKYRREAVQFSSRLAGREMGKALVREYREEMVRTRTPAGVNGAVAALNRLFDFLGVPEYRMKAVRVQRRIFREEERELTEKEYRRLVTAAGAKGMKGCGW